MTAGDKAVKPLSGWKVFAIFVAFFGVVFAVNAVFITMALKTHSGVVTEDAYKKGIHYNDTLAAARAQPEMQSALSFEDGVLSWSLKTPEGRALENASVTAEFFRPVKSGSDFSAELHASGNGIYSLKPEFPVKGAWQVHVRASWDNQNYQITRDIVVP